MLAATGWGQGVRTVVVSATRGDGGQNEIGPELFDALAAARTEELLSVHQFDGAEQYFTRAVDFGYSFGVEETFEKWGRQEILGDYVRLIRTIRPDIVIAMPGGSGAGSTTRRPVLAGSVPAQVTPRSSRSRSAGAALQALKLYRPGGRFGGRGGRGGPVVRARVRVGLPGPWQRGTQPPAAPQDDVCDVDTNIYEPLLDDRGGRRRRSGMHMPGRADGAHPARRPRAPTLRTTLPSRSQKPRHHLRGSMCCSWPGAFAGERPPQALVTAPSDRACVDAASRRSSRGPATRSRIVAALTAVRGSSQQVRWATDGASTDRPPAA
jgi:hypothetical protein